MHKRRTQAKNTFAQENLVTKEQSIIFRSSCQSEVIVFCFKTTKKKSSQVEIDYNIVTA